MIALLLGLSKATITFLGKDSPGEKLISQMFITKFGFGDFHFYATRKFFFGKR